jgi:phosphoribosylanthranilate isomerase
VIRAFRIKDDVSVLEARRHIEAIEAAGVQLFASLIDGYAPNAHGGTGQTVAENLVRLASDLHPRLVLAGGLNANNLTQRLHWTACWAVDVASGVETQPGVKDLEAVRAMTQCLGVS